MQVIKRKINFSKKIIELRKTEAKSPQYLKATRSNYLDKCIDNMFIHQTA